MAKPLNNGNNLLTGDDGDNLLDGGNGKDTLFGGAGADTLHGGNGADLLQGGEGDDVLDGGVGDDVLTGGAGADLFVLSAGNDRITDFERGGGGGGGVTETLSFEGVAEADDIADMPAGHAGLLWDGFGIADYTTMPSPPGNTAALTSGTAIAYADGEQLGPGQPGVSFRSENSADDFDLVSVHAALFRADSAGSVYTQHVVFTAFDAERGTDPVGVLEVDLQKVNTLIEFSDAFRHVDRVVITATWITADPEGTSPPAISDIDFDDLVIRRGGGPSGPVDRIAVADQATADALLASAVDDGLGNTVMTHAAGTLTLEGVSAATVAADWFVVAA